MITELPAPTSAGALLVFGFLLGLRHATDADHVAAVATIVARERTWRAAGAIGIAWGVGHSLTVLVAGAAILGFGLTLPSAFDRLTEAAVGVMLLALGALALRGANPTLPHHSPPIGTQTPSRVRRQRDVRVHHLIIASRTLRHLRSLGVGIVHGLAGSAGIALLAVPMLRTPLHGVAYLALFGVGTVLGMLVLTVAMALPLVVRWRGAEGLARGCSRLAGVASLATGLVMLLGALGRTR
ncbi:MAG: hypothetical protein MUF21_00365 [Gemmatimonadaceae bacterium]|nr:hypothetical protein [Gemmatimonadaceae bacterium]